MGKNCKTRLLIVSDDRFFLPCLLAQLVLLSFSEITSRPENRSSEATLCCLCHHCKCYSCMYLLLKSMDVVSDSNTPSTSRGNWWNSNDWPLTIGRLYVSRWGCVNTRRHIGVATFSGQHLRTFVESSSLKMWRRATPLSGVDLLNDCIKLALTSPRPWTYFTNAYCLSYSLKTTPKNSELNISQRHTLNTT